ncbi:MAG: hypothetical protein IPP66_05870 [Anaerolineales bacterium]|nr:hypothetical protein [Anaerolineales bacterium]
MIAKKDIVKPTVKKTPSKKSKSTPKKSVNHKSAESKTTVAQHQSQAKNQVIDEKSIKSLQSITNYLSVSVVSCGIGIIFNISSIISKGESVLSSALLNILGFVLSGAILYWCVRLLKQKEATSLWVFMAFCFTTSIWVFINRWLVNATKFSAIDIMILIFMIGFGFELNRLKKNGTLR